MTDSLDTSAEQTRARERVSQRERVIAIGDLEDIAAVELPKADRACTGPRALWSRLHTLAVLRSREP
jgi:hypothetical protein